MVSFVEASLYSPVCLNFATPATCLTVSKHGFFANSLSSEFLQTTKSLQDCRKGFLFGSRCAISNKSHFFSRAADYRAARNFSYRDRLVRANAVPTEKQEYVSDLEMEMREVQQLRVKVIKEELLSCGMGFADCFEKEDLVQRLAEARVNKKKKMTQASSPTSTAVGNGTAFNAKKLSLFEMPLQFVRMSPLEPRQHIILKVSIGGQGPFDFMLDTGSDESLITPQLAYGKLGITKGSGTASVGLGGMGVPGGSFAMVDIPEVKLGSYSCGQMKAVVMDLSYTRLPIYGIAGLNLLSRFDIDFQFPKRSMTFYKAGAVGRGEINTAGLSEIQNGRRLQFKLPTLQVRINGGPPEDVILDMGASASLMSWKAAGRAGLTRTSPGIMQKGLAATGIGGKSISLASTKVDIQFVTRGTNINFKVKEVIFRQAEIGVGDLAAFEALPVGLLIGTDILQHTRTLACFAENRFLMQNLQF